MVNKVFNKTALACALTLLVSSNVVNAADLNTCESTAGAVEAGYCLRDGNSYFSIRDDGRMQLTTEVNDIFNITTHVFGTDFLVDNQDLVVDKGQNAGDSLPHFGFNATDGGYMELGRDSGADISTLALTGLNTYAWGSIDLTIQLIGGAEGSQAATLIETFKITNTSGADLNLSMIAYTDVDLGGFGSGTNDYGELGPLDANGDPTSYRQWDANNELWASVDKAPTHYEVSKSDGSGDCNAALNDLCYRVNNGMQLILPSTVDNTQGDLQMAAQWVQTIAAGGSFEYTQTIELNEVPVPAAVWLFGSGLLGLVGVARRKNA